MWTAAREIAPCASRCQLGRSSRGRPVRRAGTDPPRWPALGLRQVARRRASARRAHDPLPAAWARAGTLAEPYDVDIRLADAIAVLHVGIELPRRSGTRGADTSRSISRPRIRTGCAA